MACFLKTPAQLRDHLREKNYLKIIKVRYQGRTNRAHPGLEARVVTNLTGSTAVPPGDTAPRPAAQRWATPSPRSPTHCQVPTRVQLQALKPRQSGALSAGSGSGSGSLSSAGWTGRAPRRYSKLPLPPRPFTTRPSPGSPDRADWSDRDAAHHADLASVAMRAQRRVAGPRDWLVRKHSNSIGGGSAEAARDWSRRPVPTAGRGERP